MLVAKGKLRLHYWETITAIRNDLPIYLAVAVYILAGSTYVLAKGGMLMGALDLYAHAALITYCLILPLVVLVIGILRITHHLDARRGLAYRHMFAPRRTARFFAGSLLMIAVVVLFQSMFASVKTSFSRDGFPYEKALADLDKLIHFGHSPAKYLYSFAKNEWVLRTVEFNYNVLWFVVCFGVLYWVAISPRADRIRLRFVFSFMMVWVVVGNVVAALLPTAGPAFYSLVTGDPDRFHKVRDFVGTTAGTFSSAADEQRYLWALHLAGSDGFGSGISAFPSMHVALISLMAMFATEHNRRLGIAVWVYVAFIVASSTYLGWHYAVDGYAAIILVAMVYWAVRSAPAAWRAMVPAIEAAPVPVPVPSPLPVAADPELAAG